MRVCSNRCPYTILGGEFEVSQELRLDNQPLRLMVASGILMFEVKVRPGLHLLHV